MDDQPGLRARLLQANPYAVAGAQLALLLLSGLLLALGQAAVGVVLLMVVTASNAWLVSARGRRGQPPR